MNNRFQRHSAVATALLAMSTLGHAQTTAPPSTATAGALEVFNGPKSKKLTPPMYPIGERFDENEGWVNLHFMVAPDGKPYEITVGDSTGNKRFEEIAVKTAQDWQFDPATINGVPIDAGYAIKVTFRMTDAAKGASSDFVSAYRKVMRAVQAKDRAAADAAMSKLKVTNLYEDAYINIARFSYAVVWQDKAQQLAALTRAIAHEESASYLPKDVFRKALVGMLQLQAEAQDYAGLLATWKTANDAGVDKETLSYWEPIIAKVHALKKDSRAYAVTGTVGSDSSWDYTLFKNNFKIEVASGHIAEIKLRCEKQYVFFKFDPTMLYTINERYGSCEMEAIGDPGTHFTLIQS